MPDNPPTETTPFIVAAPVTLSFPVILVSVAVIVTSGAVTSVFSSQLMIVFPFISSFKICELRSYSIELSSKNAIRSLPGSLLLGLFLFV
ncbi:hypothetical protein D3C86_2014670 [compost metagenome]